MSKTKPVVTVLIKALWAFFAPADCRNRSATPACTGRKRCRLSLAGVVRFACWILVTAIHGGALLAQSSKDTLWQPINAPASLSSQGNQPQIQPQAFAAFNLNYSVLQPTVNSAPKEANQPAAFSKSLIVLPMPDGTTASFRFVESPVMESALAAKFPEIKTYLGQGVDDPSAIARFDVTPAGFHAQILSPQGTVYVDPYYAGETNVYASYYKRDYWRPVDDFQCFTQGGAQQAMPRGFSPAFQQTLVSGSNLRTYRLACAATGEYTTFFGGTVALGLAAINTAINRVTGIYETELAIRLVLVANNDLIVYTNANTDPYTNNNPALLLTQNQANLDLVIGSANYDIGHVFNTAGGGLAAVGVVCTGTKAYGETGTAFPLDDPFYVDYVAHEIGHQFGAHHTFNSTMGQCGGGRNPSTAFEPGSGSTIMGYAGICGSDNLQANSSAYFHSVSIEEIVSFTTGGFGGCASVTATGNNAPSVSAGANYTIPAGTPFTLTASGNDPDGDSLTFCWEERDLGPDCALSTPDNGTSPLFRSFSPSTSPARTFPSLFDILNNTATPGELLPATNRIMQFRVTARDNRAGGGGVNTADMQVTVVTNGPLVVTTPSNNIVWAGQQTVTWDPGGSTNAPISATNVKISLSTNGGSSFPIILAANTPNDGSETVVLPSITSSNARVKVEALSNIFFNVCRSNFIVIPPAPQVVLNSSSLVLENCGSTNGLIDPGETVAVSFSLKNTGAANTTNLTGTLLATNGVTSPSGPQNYGALALGGGVAARTFTFTASGSCGGSVVANLRLQDGAANLGTIGVTFNMGNLLVVTQNFNNTGSITIQDNTSALPYPSTISVSGLTGAVTKVTATLSNINHTFPDDVDVLLVGPAGQKVLLMSDVGGNNSLTNVTITLDDSAASSLPDTTRINPGTFKPSNIDVNTDVFPAPAPASPYVTNLSVFNGQNPNGTWSLYVRDDGPNDAGNIAGGWFLSITTSNSVCCSGSFVSSDLAIGQTLLPGFVNVGSNLTATLAVTNLGPGSGSGVVVTDSLPAGLSFVSAVATQGSCTNNGNVVSCSLGTMTNGAVAFVTVVATANTAGVVSNFATVSSASADFGTTNNNASATALVNAFPFMSAISDQLLNEDSATPPLAFIVSDAETPAGSLTVLGGSSNTNLVPNTNIVFGGSGSNRTVTVTPLAYHFGTALITLTVSDGAAATNRSFLVTVTQSNHPPALAAVTNFTITENSALVFTNSAVDLDVPAQTLAFSLGNVPSGASINATNGIFAWTPLESQGPGTNLLTVVVTDNGTPALSATQSFTIVVLESNSAPVLAPITNQTVVEGQSLTVTNSATDPDLPTNSLTFTLGTNAPAGAVINPTNGLFTWTPAESQGPGTNVIAVIVTDNGTPVLSATQSFTVVVLETNSAPVLAPLADQTVVEGLLLAVTNSATDPDIPTNTLVFSLDTNAPAGAAINATNGLFTWTPGETQGPGTNVIAVIVTDNGTPALSATQSFTVVVLETNSPPVLAPIAAQTVRVGRLLVVTNNATDPDVPANALTFSLDTNAPVGAAINPSNGLFTWTSGAGQSPSTNLITVFVSDDGLPPLTAAQSFQIVVTNASQPKLTITDQVVVEGTLLVVTNLQGFFEITNSITFSLDTNAPAGASLNPTNGLFTWTPTEAQGPSTNIITNYVAFDDLFIGIVTQTFVVIVLESNVPPLLSSISSRTIHAGTTLIFTNSASDSDLPTNVLSFSLASNAPPAASVGSANGLFVWSTTDADANTTNTITVQVTDNGSPVLSDSKSFTVAVLPRPTVASLAISNQLATLTWSAISGQVYRAQFKDSFDASNWTDVTPDVAATDALALQTNVVGGIVQRFYRVRVLP